MVYVIILKGMNLEDVKNRLDEWRLALDEKDWELVEIKQSIDRMNLGEETNKLKGWAD